MSALPQRFVEDRQLRDAARAVLVDDISRLRENLAEEGIASRVSSGVSSTISARIKTGARDVLAQAKAQASDHQGVLAVLIGAIILWLGRGPIMDWLSDFAGDDTDLDTDTEDAQPAAAAPGDCE